MKSKVSRLLVFAASVVLVVALFAPLWHYNFVAPQYPEGLRLRIYANHIGGRVNLINELNHYVGMGDIREERFPELRVIPWLVVGLFVSGLSVCLAGGLRALIGWLGAFAVCALALLLDFYHWLYVYGHYLDPHAAIKIPPFTPYIVGRYSFLNFHIVAYPGIGGAAMIVSFLLGASALWLEWSALRRAPVKAGARLVA